MTTTPMTPEQMLALADETLRLGIWHRRATAALRSAANQLEAVQDRDRISSAVGEVLFNVSNYPPSVSFRLLGQNIGPLRAKVTDAVLAAITERHSHPRNPRLCDESGCTFMAGHESEHSWGGVS